MSTTINNQSNYFTISKKPKLFDYTELKMKEEENRIEKFKAKLIKKPGISDGAKFLDNNIQKSTLFRFKTNNVVRKFPLINNKYSMSNYLRTEYNPIKNNTIFHNEKINEKLIENEKEKNNNNNNILLKSLFTLPGAPKIRSSSLLKNYPTAKSLENNIYNKILTPKIKIKAKTLKNISLDNTNNSNNIINITSSQILPNAIPTNINTSINKEITNRNYSYDNSDKKSNINNKKKRKGGIKDLNSFFKNKYFEDIGANMNKKLKDKIFCHDPSIKDKLVEINQVGKFWETVLEYWIPYFTIQKLKFSKKMFDEDRKNIRKEIKVSVYDEEDEYLKQSNKKNSGTPDPKLYTSKYLMNLAHSNYKDPLKYFSLKRKDCSE